MKTAWKPNKAILSDWDEDSGQNVSKATLIRKWANDETRSLYSNEQYSKQLALIDIDESVGNLPDNFYKIIQAAYGHGHSKHSHKHFKREYVSEWVSRNHYDGCEITIRAKCPKCHQTDCSCSTSFVEYEVNSLDRASHPEWYKPYTFNMYRIGRVADGSYVHGDDPHYRLMRPRTNSFFNINAHIKGCVNFNVGGKITYEIHDNSRIEVNLKKCKVLISYLGYRLDDEGYYMIPDLPIVWQSIRSYIDMKIAYGHYSRTYDTKFERAFLTLNNLHKEKHYNAKVKLSSIEPERLKAIWDNVVGKTIPNYYAEETYYESVDDRYTHLDHLYK